MSSHRGVNLGIHQSDVSVIWDLAPHDFSILFDWLGEYPNWVWAHGRIGPPFGQPDVAFIGLQFPSGCVANLHLSWLAPTKVRRMTVVGSRRMAVYEDTLLDEPVGVYDKGVEIHDPEDFAQYKLTYRTGDIVSPRIEVWEPLHAELEDFLDRVKREDVPGPAEAALRVATAEAAERSLRSGSVPVTL